MTHISVAIPTKTFISLYEFLKSEGDVRDPSEVVPTAIEYWLDNAAWKGRDLLKKVYAGYRWKELFLPDGTQVRMRYKGQYSYAAVKGDEFVWDGQPSSPGQFANGVAQSSRNAWRDLELRRPNDTEWILAAELRKQA
jgi:hypothetical protein